MEDTNDLPVDELAAMLNLHIQNLSDRTPTQSQTEEFAEWLADKGLQTTPSLKSPSIYRLPKGSDEFVNDPVELLKRGKTRYRFALMMDKTAIELLLQRVIMDRKPGKVFFGGQDVTDLTPDDMGRLMEERASAFKVLAVRGPIVSDGHKILPAIHVYPSGFGVEDMLRGLMSVKADRIVCFDPKIVNPTPVVFDLPRWVTAAPPPPTNLEF